MTKDGIKERTEFPWPMLDVQILEGMNLLPKGKDHEIRVFYFDTSYDPYTFYLLVPNEKLPLFYNEQNLSHYRNRVGPNLQACEQSGLTNPRHDKEVIQGGHVTSIISNPLFELENHLVFDNPVFHLEDQLQYNLEEEGLVAHTTGEPFSVEEHPNFQYHSIYSLPNFNDISYFAKVLHCSKAYDYVANEISLKLLGDDDPLPDYKNLRWLMGQPFQPGGDDTAQRSLVMEDPSNTHSHKRRSLLKMNIKGEQGKRGPKGKDPTKRVKERS